MELYVLPDSLPPFLKSAGIPVTLLHLPQYLPAWMHYPRQEQDVPLDWPAFVVQSVFSDERYQLVPYRGYCKYSSWPPATSLRDVFANGNGIDFWLKLWLEEMISLQPSKYLPLDVIDLAAICQILISSGVDHSTANVRMHFMQPFGYVRPMTIIGGPRIRQTTSTIRMVCVNVMAFLRLCFTMRALANAPSSSVTPFLPSTSLVQRMS